MKNAWTSSQTTFAGWNTRQTAGHGASAAQAINADLFQEDLRTHALRQYREKQIHHARTEPAVLDDEHASDH